MLCSRLRSSDFINDDAQIRFACQDGGDGDEVTLGGVGDDLRERGLACAWRSPQNDGRKKFVGFDGAAQELAFADDMFLPDVFIQCARTHPRGKRGFGFMRSCMAWSKRSLDMG